MQQLEIIRVCMHAIILARLIDNHQFMIRRLIKSPFCQLALVEREEFSINGDDFGVTR